MTADQLAYQFGGVIGTIIVLLLLSQLLHWIVRKIRRKPKKLFRDWLRSWIAGPELFLFGALCVRMYEDSSLNQLSFFLGIALVWAGMIIFPIKIIASIVSRFRRRASVSPPLTPAVAPPVQPLGRQPRLH
jgi:amino acid transporter